MKTLLNTIYEKVKTSTDLNVFSDLFSMCRECAKTDEVLAVKYARLLSSECEKAIVKADNTTIKDLFAFHNRVLLFLAPHDFESYMLYLEKNRPPERQFYRPRRRVLKPLVAAIQKLTDNELDELFLSMPPRVGKTTILMFYCTWLVGRDSEKSNLYSAYSGIITSAFYDGCLEVINDPVTYLWHDVFPSAKVVSTNAKDTTFDIDRKKRYPSLTCRSLYGTLNGACDCNGILMSDDLIGGIEEALNKDRLVSAWSKVDNNLLPRAKEGAKVLWCGTRWSMTDPAGLRMELLLNDPAYAKRRFEIINLPALDENEHSNFHYAYGVGFSDDYYIQRRASFERNNDMASWVAQYQGEPIERSGALFEPQDMKFYNGILPDEKTLVRRFMAVDPAFGGGDFTASPICYQYEDGSIYVVDVMYNDGDKRVTQPMLVSKIMKYNVDAVRFEANRSTVSYKEEVEKELQSRGVRVNITTKAAPNTTSKEMRIYDKAPEIREFYFLEDGKRSKEYSLFMQNVYSFKLTGKNKHDDSVDSLAQAAEMITRGSKQVEVFKRPW